MKPQVQELIDFFKAAGTDYQVFDYDENGDYAGFNVAPYRGSAYLVMVDLTSDGVHAFGAGTSHEGKDLIETVCLALESSKEDFQKRIHDKKCRAFVASGIPCLVKGTPAQYLGTIGVEGCTEACVVLNGHLCHVDKYYVSFDLEPGAT